MLDLEEGPKGEVLEFVGGQEFSFRQGPLWLTNQFGGVENKTGSGASAVVLDNKN